MPNRSSLIIPIITYGFTGIEIMTVTASEARDLRSLRRPSQYIAYFVFAIYFFCSVGELLNVNWTDSALPHHYVRSATSLSTDGSETMEQSGRSQALVVIAALKANNHQVAGFLNGCLVFSALSAANTSLYVGSRVLYGMARKKKRSPRFQYLKGLGAVWSRTGVPVRALIVSYLAFIWLPFLRLRGDIAVSDVSVSESIWSSLMLQS